MGNIIRYEIWNMHFKGNLCENKVSPVPGNCLKFWKTQQKNQFQYIIKDDNKYVLIRNK